jgi:hypothetical protein
MDTASLESAYRRIIDLASQGGFDTQPEDGWTAELLLAHVAVNDELLEATARAVLAHAPDPSYDNALAIDTEHLRKQGTLPELIDRLQTTSRQLADVANQLTDGLEDVEVPVRILDNDTVVVDQPLPIGRLLEIQAAVHLASHLSQLEELHSSGS